MLDTTAIILAITALFSFLNYRFIKLPTTIGVMVISLVISVVLLVLQYAGFDGVTQQARTFIQHVNFDEVVMKGMLSLLLFAGALHVNINDLLERKWAIGLMATIGVLLTTFIVGFVSFYIFSAFGFSIPLIYCLLFGSLIAPTDPIAVLGILKQAKAPKSLEIKITGESLFNDGIAVVVFVVLLGIAQGGEDVSVGHIALVFAEEAIGGVVYGLVLGYLGYKMLTWVDNYQVEILITLALVVSGYTLAGHIHVSGPLAIVVAGLMIGNKGRMFAMSDTSREHIDTFWELIDEILNAVLFVLIGIEVLALAFDHMTLAVGFVLIPIILLARLASTTFLLGALRLKETLTRHAELILTWGGLRGAISVALALALPPGDIRDTILTVTYIIVVFSILVQGLTLGKLIQLLIKKP
ncbi:MAG: sodium:proton antiporter [Pseudomonadales bacterium]|nr:sodium:proton antiporter [Pseudomonadales bacterium]